ncbi:elongation factor 1-beta [Candidatus Woesearchaeota archaeon]|nr:elongation factor 1-beta [Candidatus Woesearchaeota archaeon]
MADVVVTLKIMPESPEIDLSGIEDGVKKMVEEFGGEVGKTEQEPIAFGLKALKVMFVMSEDLGSTESLEENVAGLEGVNSVEVTDVRRTIG